MKAGDIVALSNNYFIMATTISRYSHVAIAADESYVYETTVGGVRRVTLEKCIAGARHAYIFSAPRQFPEDDIALMAECFKNEQHSGDQYSFVRSGYAGFQSIVDAWVFIITLGLVSWSWWTGTTQYLFFAIGCLLFYPLDRLAKKCARHHCLKKLSAAFRRKTQDLPAKYCVVKWASVLVHKLTRDLPNKFCSQTVVDLDARAGGMLFKNIFKAHEARPCDVVQACENMGYKRTKLPRKL